MKRNIKKLILISFTMICIFKINAQDGPKVVVFNSPETEEERTFDTKNLLKLSLLEAVSGDISFYYERILKEKLSAEVGLGITLNDYLSIIMDNLESETSDRKPLLGSSFALGLRYYPFMASDEFYFSLNSNSDITIVHSLQPAPRMELNLTPLKKRKM